MPVKRPHLGAVMVAVIPFVAMCFSVALWDRIEPRILGVPFNLAWLVCWIVLCSVCMATAYRIEKRRPKDSGGE